MEYIIPWTLAGAWSFRMRGGGWPRLPRIVDLTIWGLLLTIPLWFIAPWWAAILGVSMAMALTSFGHGDFLDMGSGTGDPDEPLAKVVTFLTGQSDGFWRDGLGMAMSGTTYLVGPTIIALVFGSPWWLLWVSVGFLGKGTAYLVGKRLQKYLNVKSTVVAEYMTGFLMTGGTSLLWWFI